jgi:type IV secretion system protein VirB3
MDQDRTLIEDPLFLACTRPAMVAGVTLEAMALNGMVTMISFVVSSSFWALLVGVAIHCICRQIVRVDHNAFRILAAWADTRGRCRNAVFWGGSTVSPLRLGRTHTERDL